jgi:putative ABC transport system substrate-binding protein
MAQQAAKVPRIAFLGANTAERAREPLAAFRQALRERNWIDGENIHVEFRFADGKVDKLPALVAALIQLKVDLIVAGSSASTDAARNATRTIPIVMGTSSDALGEGFVTNLARPGGNITGMTFLAGPELAGKQLELLKEFAPSASRVAVLENPDNRSHAAFIREMTTSPPGRRVRLQVVGARSPDQLAQAFAKMTGGGATALLVLTDSQFYGRRRAIVSFAAKNRLPAIYSQKEFVNEGGLMSYGPSLSDMYRRAVAHVDKILKGAKPGDLPVEQPTKFELVINAKTADALGLAIPQSLLLRADQVVK